MLPDYFTKVIREFSIFFLILFSFNSSVIASNMKKVGESFPPRKRMKLMPTLTVFVLVHLMILGVGTGSALGFSVDVSPTPPLVEPVVVAPCEPTEVQYTVKVFGDVYTKYSLSFHEAPLNHSFNPQIVYGNQTSMLTVYLPLVVSRPYYKDYTLHIRATSPGNLMASDETRLIIANFTIEGSPAIKPVRALSHDTMQVTVSPYPPGYPAIPGTTEFFYDIKDQVSPGNIFHSVYFNPTSLSQTSGGSTFHFQAPYIVGRYKVKFYAQYGSHYSNGVETLWYFIDVSGVPEVSTGATNGCGLTGVNLLGNVNAMYSINTSTWFEWGETTLYGHATNAQVLPGYGRTDVAINHRVGGLKPQTEYHYRIVARNEWGTVFGNDRVFETLTPVNSPPNIPHSPSPVSGAIFQDSNLDLNWQGGDPDPGDVVTYDVYFGKSLPPPLVSEAQLETSYDPGVLEDTTIYYWKVIATDSCSSISEGPNWQFALDTSVVLSFLCEDNNGVVTDACGNDNNGTVNGAVFTPGQGILNSNAYQFNWSTSDNIQVAYQESQIATEALTLEAWVYPTAWDNIHAHYNRIVSKQPVYLLRGKANGRAHFQVLTENHGFQCVSDSQVMSLNEWHYVVGTFDGLFLMLYVDGILRDSLELPEEDSISTNEADIFVGESQWLAEGFTGTIDNVAIYKSARSQSEIEETYASVMLRCEGDFNGDSDVDGSDLAAFAADFGRTDCDQGQECEGDFNGDGDVDGSDLAVFAADFGRTDCP